jgi:hypothetical protein
MNTRQNVCDFQSGLIERVRRLHQKYNYLDLKLINYRKLRSCTRVLVRATIRIIGTVLKDTYIYWDTTPPLWKDDGCHNGLNIHNNKSQTYDLQDGRKSKSMTPPFLLTWNLNGTFFEIFSMLFLRWKGTLGYAF